MHLKLALDARINNFFILASSAKCSVISIRESKFIFTQSELITFILLVISLNRCRKSGRKRYKNAETQSTNVYKRSNKELFVDNHLSFIHRLH